jgi:hypothetical protein
MDDLPITPYRYRLRWFRYGRRRAKADEDHPTDPNAARRVGYTRLDQRSQIL